MLLSMVAAGIAAGASFLIHSLVPFASGIPGVAAALALPLAADALLLDRCAALGSTEDQRPDGVTGRPLQVFCCMGTDSDADAAGAFCSVGMVRRAARLLFGRPSH